MGFILIEHSDMVYTDRGEIIDLVGVLCDFLSENDIFIEASTWQSIRTDPFKYRDCLINSDGKLVGRFLIRG